MLDITTRQANFQVFQLIKVNGLLKIPKKELNNSDQSDNNEFGFFKTLEESILLILWQ